MTTAVKKNAYNVWISHELYHELLFRDFNKNECLFLVAIIRFQLGFSILNQARLEKRDFECFGIAKTTIDETIKSLLEKKVIIADEIFYRLNINIGEWKVEDRKNSERADFEALITKHIAHQKKIKPS